MNDAKPPYAMSTYLVLPVRSKTEPDIQSCLYFDWSGERVDPSKLDSAAQGYKTSFVCLQQTSLARLSVELTDHVAVEGVTLFAAVAKTRHENLQMPSLFLADVRDDGNTLVLPVFAHSHRSVILVFSDKDGVLIASSDPEIKNSTGV